MSLGEPTRRELALVYMPEIDQFCNYFKATRLPYLILNSIVHSCRYHKPTCSLNFCHAFLDKFKSYSSISLSDVKVV
ncbi:hypothetical protein EUGRSUZ_A01330 [Eucalyptus grandis]|uniref:Uncharacterized protein n=2 Tax=Eucalyptus grandis TaxID=71139 RepID=A0ACC3LZQ3_EUCGR|nr:hypothetical protein EUGRSUZ_A01330 [Eucalyptus grandis]